MLKITNEDNMELMARYPDNYFDLAIVDPPYGIDITNSGWVKSNNNIKTNNNWDNKIPSKEYFNELKRVSKNQIIWGGNYFELPPCKNYVIWDKEIPLGLSFADCEMAWTSFNNAPRIFRHSAYLDKKNKFHPTQKPVKLYRWLLQNYAKEGDKILDTHLGSGSSRIASDMEGFDFYACELDKDYFEASCKRFDEYKKQIKLF